jgi:hypothetical protein
MINIYASFYGEVMPMLYFGGYSFGNESHESLFHIGKSLEFQTDFFFGTYLTYSNERSNPPPSLFCEENYIIP